MSTSDKLAYVKTFETKIIRRKHRIGFRAGGCTAQSLIATLESVPALALVDEVETDENGITTILFHEEVADAVKP